MSSSLADKPPNQIRCERQFIQAEQAFPVYRMGSQLSSRNHRHRADGSLSAQCLDSRRGDAGCSACGLSLSRFGRGRCWIILAISIVWTAESLNTAFEFLADAASPEFHPLVRDAKDVAAGAVLLTATAAVVIGSIVFWPYVER